MSNRVEVTLSAAGNSQWLPLNWARNNPVVSLIVRLSSGAVLTYRVQHSQDSARTSARRVTISRTTTTATVTDVAHKLTTGDSVFVEATDSSNLDQLTGVDVTVTGADTYTYTVANSGAAADGGRAKVRSYRVQPHPTMVDLTANADANYAFPVCMVRLRVTAYTSGSVNLTVLEGN